MPLTMHQIMIAQADMLADNYEFSAATFTPATGSAVQVRCELYEDIETQPTGFSTQVYAHRIVIEAILEDMPGGVEPNAGEVFSIGGTDYTIESIELSDRYFVRCIVK